MEPGFVLNFHFSLYIVLIAIVGVFFVFFKELRYDDDEKQFKN